MLQKLLKQLTSFIEINISLFLIQVNFQKSGIICLQKIFRSHFDKILRSKLQK